ncbi:methylaspartate mutase accessory protein GlmL [Halothermothrix orenii]|uniref:MutL protein n=1 Tax=Halothermothrix orenii (strain H 168 / OCM 544 / DSM 9562) TaxID=373903 RepID=B8CYC5_HALOH|nr:methylaspartate mutase accessory protein GlmL [Halothermothrix orenii]ACL70294.1 conserved hypothetical protein TIGR01319 [Halothermothrix orenii H 168]
METALLIDIGSTYTKVTLIDLEKIEIRGQSQAHTTVFEDVTIGLKEALAGIKDWEKARYKLACSSAAGGLKIVAIGLVPDLTAEAARRAALGAGSKVLKTYSFELTDSEVREIEGIKPDIILLAGGTDGGNKDVIIHNAKKLAKCNLEQPIIVAGNRVVADEVEKILSVAGKEVHVTENVMPRLEELNIQPARETIREIFLNKIIQAKGLDRVNNFIDGVIMPTPAAVLNAASLLADGTGDEEGLGELMVVDIGGATTDVHSIASGKPTRSNVNLRGLEEPYVKRTVEGDLGMRYNAPTLIEAVGINKFVDELKEMGVKSFDCDSIVKYISTLHDEPDYIPQNEGEQVVDNLMGRHAARMGVSRHVGRLKTVYTPMGASLIQEGKDLSRIEYLIGTGGIIVNNPDPGYILSGTLYDNHDDPELLAPVSPDIMIDSKYIMAAAGLLGEVRPEESLKLMKKYIKEI